MKEAYEPNTDYQKLPLRHPLREKRELLMTSQQFHEFSSALVGIRFLRVVLPYVVLLVGALIAWNGLVGPHDVHIILAFTGMWVGADVLVRYADRRAKTAEAELESLDREIAAEIDRLATAVGSGQ